jgi:uncharacterized pyridoxamine 5'-phosphate oxidase family protein
MDVEYNSDWVYPRVEIIKYLHDLSFGKYNDDVGGYQYKDENDETLLLVISDQDGETQSVSASNAGDIVSIVEEEQYKEVYIVAKNQTKTAYESLKDNDKITLITSNSRIQLTENEILSAFYETTKQICKEQCESEEIDIDDCLVNKKGSGICKIRNIIDNAEFHARMKWKEQLLNDYSLLKEYETNQ